MAQAYSRKLDVLNRGFGGYNSEWALPIFDEIFKPSSTSPSGVESNSTSVRLVTIWFGANDACLPVGPTHLPIEKYSANLKHYVDSLLNPKSAYYQPNAHVLLITPPPICKAQRDEHKLQYLPQNRWQDRTLANTALYKDAVLSVVQEARANNLFARIENKARKSKVAVVNVFDRILEEAGSEDDEDLRPFFTDGLHLTEKGYAIVFEEVMKVVKAEFAGLDPEDQSVLPLRFPQ